MCSERHLYTRVVKRHAYLESNILSNKHHQPCKVLWSQWSNKIRPSFPEHTSGMQGFDWFPGVRNTWLVEIIYDVSVTPRVHGTPPSDWLLASACHSDVTSLWYTGLWLAVSAVRSRIRHQFMVCCVVIGSSGSPLPDWLEGAWRHQNSQYGGQWTVVMRIYLCFFHLKHA